MGDSSTSPRRSILWMLLLLSLAIDVPLPAMAGPSARVVLRIEGESSTIFEGEIVTRGHNVTSASGGTHHCDGTNNGANPRPGPTPTSALDDAARRKGFTWDGTYDLGFDDYFVTRIGASAQTSSKFWGLLVGYQFTSVGGCQAQVGSGDEVLWAYDAFNKVNFLKLTGPARASRNKPFQLTVTNGQNGHPVAGAVVGGKTTDASGRVTITVRCAGPSKFKAEEPSSLRSNSITVQVS